MRKSKREKMLNKIKNEIGYTEKESFYTIKPKYLRKLFKEISKSVKWKNGISKEIYILVSPNGRMESFKVTTYEDIDSIIAYTLNYNMEYVELHVDINDTISIHFKDNAYNKYYIYFDL